MKHTRQSAGSLGGRATVRRHGRQHMAEIGKKGAEAMHARYSLTPYGIGDFAIVDKRTGTIKAFLSGVKSWK